MLASYATPANQIIMDLSNITTLFLLSSPPPEKEEMVELGAGGEGEEGGRLEKGGGR